MSYVQPQVLVFQEANTVPTALLEPLRGVVVGPNAELIRYAETDERTNGLLGSYDPTVDQDFTYPNRPVGAVIDQSYTKLFGEDLLLRYFEDLIGSGPGTVAPVSGYQNRIRSSVTNFASNGSLYPRSAALEDRDVQVGDVVYTRGTVSSTTYENTAKVMGLVADEGNTSHSHATADTDNASEQASLYESQEQVAGDENCIVITDVDGSSYNGLLAGNPTETYTLTVTKSSVDGDLTTARVRVTSASGNDNQDSLTPSAAGSPTAIGTRGLEITWDLDIGHCSVSASAEDVSAEDLLAGQVWEVTVKQIFEETSAGVDGTYTGTADDTYIVTVTRGGKFTDTLKPQITVTTASGTDLSGPTTVPDSGELVAMGTKGLSIAFGGSGASVSYNGDDELVSLDDTSGLCKGDRFYVDVTGPSAGPIRTIILSKNLPAALLAATDLDLRLFIPQTGVEIPSRSESPGVYNWTATADEVTVEAGMTMTDPSWTVGGEVSPLPVQSGTLYLEYRAWLSDVCDNIRGASTDEDLAGVPGPNHPDNPLKYALGKAILNANGTEVRYLGVCNPDSLDSWADAVEKFVGTEGNYGFVPLSTDPAVQNLFAIHIASSSSPNLGLWRAGWFAISQDQTVKLLDSTLTTNGQVAKCLIQDNAFVSGTQYTWLTLSGGNANFIDLEIRAGDEVRTNYTADGFGGVTYDSFVVDAVINDDTLRLVTGNDVAINTAQKFEVWRTLNATEYATKIAETPSRFASARIKAVWPDVVEDGDLVVPGYFLCAAYAGLASGVVPHQGLTQLEIAGFSGVPRTTQLFNKSQLDTMAAAGVFIVTRDNDNHIFSRHAITTGDQDNLNTREEMVVRNVDSISFIFLRRLAPFIGVSNVTPSALAQLRVEIDSTKEYLKTNGFVERLGAQIIDAEVTKLAQHALLKDRVVIVLTLQLPYPMNNIEVHLVF